MKTITYFKLLLFYLITNSAITLYAQQYDATWVMGYANTIYKFDSASILRVDSFSFDKSLYFFLSGTCMSDRNGNLLYISNGLQINDKNGNPLEGGDQLALGAFDTASGGYDFRQSPLSIPMPGNDSLYYFFYEAYWDTILNQCSRLYYSIINMNANNGLGRVISLNNILIDTFISDGGLSACKHANGVDWWLVKPIYKSNQYCKFLVKADGAIEGPFVQNIGLVSRPPDYNAQIVFSPTGDKMFYTNGLQKGSLFDFDRCTGTLSNPRYVWGMYGNETGGGEGASFSPSGRFLYLTGDTFKLYQVDTYSDNIDSSKIVLFRIALDSDQWPAYHQLAPNGKIYIMGYSGATPLSVINYPDSFGLTCEFDAFFYDSLPAVTLGMPNFPYYRTPPSRAYQAGAGHDKTICFGDTVVLGVPQVDSIIYQWTSNASFLSNTNIAQPSVAPTQTTSYYLTINDTVPHGYSCNVRTDTVTVHVVPLPCTVGERYINSDAKASIKVYPNPAGDAVIVNYSIADFNNGPLDLQISDVLGHVVYTKTLPDNSGLQKIDVSHFAAGLYTIYVKRGNGVVATQKLVKE